jgi:uncharacterized membrane protein YkvA (DUF1232 family)
MFRKINKNNKKKQKVRFEKINDEEEIALDEGVEIVEVEKLNKNDKKQKVIKFLDKFVSKAENKTDDEKYIQKLEGKTEHIIKNKSDKISDKISSPAKKVWDYIKDPKSDTALKITAIGVIIYLVSPIDALPDFIPVVGFVDDIAALTIMVTLIVKNVGQIVEGTKSTVKKLTKNIADGVTESLDEGVERQSKIRIRQQLIITAISLGGAILIGIIALIIAYLL